VKRVPILLTALRAGLAPVVVFLAFRWPMPAAFGTCLVLAFLSDVFDGIVARRLGIATPALRRLDSVADTLFYAGAVAATWHVEPDAVSGRWVPLSVLLALEAGRYAFDFHKFGREASYHMWSSKAWAIALFAAFFSLLVFGENGRVVDAAICIGIVADLEGLAISLTLRRWRSDVPSVFHAMRLRA